MFVRKLKRKHARTIAVHIVESHRVNGKPRQTIVEYCGSAPPGPMLDQLVAAAELRLDQLELQRQPQLFARQLDATWIETARERPNDEPLPIADARRLHGEEQLLTGIHDVFGRLFDELQLERIWTSRHRVSAGVFRHTVLTRLALPGESKLALATQWPATFGITPTKVERIYRMMDALDDARIDRLRALIADASTALLDHAPQAVLMDLTTLAFASERADELRLKGYSKDGKPHRVQVVLALIQTPQGLPLDYRLFPGNTTDVTTLQTLATTLRDELGVNRVTVVCDAGMTSQANLDALANAGLDYVAGARLGTLSLKDLQVIDQSPHWQSTADDKRVLDHRVGKRRLVLHHDPVRARKDAYARKADLAKAQEVIDGKRSAKRMRFLINRVQNPQLNTVAIAKAELRDGLHGVWTSHDVALSPHAIRSMYADLWRIEQSFRVLKHTMQVRPVFHWTEPRVRAHVAICYTAFALLRVLRDRYRTAHPDHPPLSEERLLAELRNVTTTKVHDRDTDRRYLMPTSLRMEQRMIYSAVGAKPQTDTILLDGDA